LFDSSSPSPEPTPAEKKKAANFDSIFGSDSEEEDDGIFSGKVACCLFFLFTVICHCCFLFSVIFLCYFSRICLSCLIYFCIIDNNYLSQQPQKSKTGKKEEKAKVIAVRHHVEFLGHPISSTITSSFYKHNPIPTFPEHPRREEGSTSSSFPRWALQ